MRTVAFGALLLLASCTQPDATRRSGQWIWTAADATVLERARAARPEFVAGVWVASITYDTLAKAPTLRLALPPRTAGRDSVAVVVRFEQSFDAAWRSGDDARLTAQLDARFAALRRMLDAQPVIVQEMQLDYDVPVRLLPRWSAVLRTLVHGPLADREIWVTSLVAHLRDARFGRLLRGVVAGHMLQVFDTGEPADPRRMREVVRLLDRTDLPFRLGVGAFERQLGPGRRTLHRAWFRLIPELQQHRRWRGVWIFPAGMPWTSLLGAPS